MYVLDYRHNKQVRDFSEHLLRKYNTSNSNKVVEAFYCFVGNTFKHLKSTGDTTNSIVLHKRFFSMNLVYNGQRVHRKVSAIIHRKVIDFLEQEGYIILTKGGYVEISKDIADEWLVHKTQMSTYTVTNKFLEECDEYLRKYIVPKPESLISVRRKDKEDLQFKMTPELKIKKFNLEEYNSLSDTTPFKNNNGERQVVYLHKIYTDNLKSNGRNHTMFGNFQCLSKKERSECELEINGEWVSLMEYDFKSLFPCLLYEKEGITLQKGFDPYYIESPRVSYDKEELRQICKLALLILINSNTYQSALGSLSHKLYEDYHKADKDSVEFNTIHQATGNCNKERRLFCRAIIGQIKENNKGIAKYFHSGEGLKLMFTESEIMDKIISYFTGLGILVIPVHDSVAVPENCGEDVAGVMEQAYLQVVGSSNNCVIERSY